MKPVEPGGSFKYLGRYLDYDMDNSEHKRETLQDTQHHRLFTFTSRKKLKASAGRHQTW